MQTQREHVNDNGASCPACGNAEQVEGHEVTTGGGMAYQDMVCLMCEAAWEDCYSLTSYNVSEE